MELEYDSAKNLWKPLKHGYQESLKYLQGRQQGLITSLKTPWDKVNDATIDGFEWHNMIVVGARPGCGKTVFKDQLIKESFILNPNDEFRVLDFQLEMLARASAIRQYSSELGLSYKELCSAEGKLSKTDLQRCLQFAKSAINNPVDIIENPPTVFEFANIIKRYMSEFKKKTYTKTLITVDHSILLKRASGQKHMDMLYDFGEICTKLKRIYPITFLILSQLNRDINRPERNEEGKYGNYILDSDIFGADALLQHADAVIGLDIPAKRKLRIYGPDKYIIDSEQVMAMHFLKLRNGDPRMSFFKAAFNKMRIEEGTAPAQMEIKSNNYS